MVEIKLHDIGEGMTEAEVTHFLVKPGDKVAVDQPVVEVSTDKMTAEIPAPQQGVVKELLVEEGKTISIGTTVVVLETSGEAERETAATVELEKEPVKAEAPLVQSFEVTAPDRRVKAAPYTRKVARELDVDIEEVEGTGVRGRITVEDVKRYAEPVPESPDEVEEQMEATTENLETIPFRGRRKQIANKMTQSLFTIPHCTHFEEIDVTELLNIKQELKQEELSISATAFFVKAVSVALQEFPVFNARLDEENETIRLIKEHHIGIATDTAQGLIVPVLKNVEEKSLQTIHEEMKALTQKAVENRLKREEMTGSTFTISNVGPLGGSIGATPIINYPEVGLMAFHKTKRRPMVVNEDEIAIRSMMNISMVFDHRVTDGGTAVSFTNRVQTLIERPYLLFVDLK
ncbi:dihydrolipoamide acetyltransferase component of pyruvate dehydrogenase complex [Thalassobacillus devorans]|uniref:Dihydrolipoamide acetyltransferase component of pyruvate dehydrogenase complex n=1 Tax=Thalassobacillus devorans TaxID=279813 RepID=A0ABQ1PQV5_9BACI|nr:dihydrolipoamide acetyltransferase family protein [Thalassobacillus devorans]NIK30349.1 pyruvate dehydrogenase E2 component (dihydrolipoamide acetyltransferase) [Thalassobacillus devorans]GGD00980.1 dihydrolipoamide acetyltransferase component of pyruvate dehydrogenase complex [Thalassobacillus devorans]